MFVICLLFAKLIASTHPRKGDPQLFPPFRLHRRDSRNPFLNTNASGPQRIWRCVLGCSGAAEHSLPTSQILRPHIHHCPLPKRIRFNPSLSTYQHHNRSTRVEKQSSAFLCSTPKNAANPYVIPFTICKSFLRMTAASHGTNSTINLQL